MSFRGFLVRIWLKNVEKPALARASVERARSSFEKKTRTFLREPPGTVFNVVGLGTEETSSPTLSIDQPGARARILYFHGGGYVFGSPHTHRALVAWISHYSGFSASLVGYRRAPENPFPAALEDALQAYRFAQEAPGGVILGGDSAGGGLALALLGEISRLGLPMPLGTFAFSPLTDLSLSSETIRTNAEADVVLPAQRAIETAQMYLAGADPRDPRASPVFADFTGATPVWLSVSDTEILLDDSLRMAARLKEQGVPVTLVQEANLPHVWPLFKGYIPEAERTLRDLAGWLRSLSGRTGDS